ncbi:C1 protein [Lindernia anagallis yellow vein betasatellite]|uniref:C1 protein n=1 Tax=Lindernia anagallis yellow vein betasatellite TaxID=447605 RepID=A5H1F9_9VIRU|nr:C1 protein [Lindernia anagallis yellow vein betasatellite]ABG26125.1 C1 protein [Lindernia anagallis yellow vein betasatellite]
MTIRYQTSKNIHFTIDVHLKNRVTVTIRLIYTRSPVMTAITYNIPYTAEENIPPPIITSERDGAEDHIHHILYAIYDDVDIKDFKPEMMLDAVDIMMMDRFDHIGIDTDGSCRIRTIHNV